MKQCPSCKTTYTDDSLRFCLSDGTPLISAEEEQPTVVRSAKNDPLRVVIPTPSVQAAATSPERSSVPSTLLKVLIAAVVLVILAVVGLGLAGAAFYYGTGSKPPETPIRTPSPSPTTTATPDTEKDKLKDEIANIQKQLDQQKKNANTWSNSDPDEERGSSITATVDSPNDGFLALRSEPDADRGERIATIPHGAEVEIQNCERSAVSIGGRSGRWCQVSYKGLTGWAFDAWLEY